jgi:hypothetical protein
MNDTLSEKANGIVAELKARGWDVYDDPTNGLSIVSTLIEAPYTLRIKVSFWARRVQHGAIVVPEHAFVHAIFRGTSVCSWRCSDCDDVMHAIEQCTRCATILVRGMARGGDA